MSPKGTKSTISLPILKLELLRTKFPDVVGTPSHAESNSGSPLQNILSSSIKPADVTSSIKWYKENELYKYT